MKKELPNGSTVELVESEWGPEVVVDNPAAPEDMRNHVAGRLIGPPEEQRRAPGGESLGLGFQPAPFSAFALGPEMLRAIADLCEQKAGK